MPSFRPVAKALANSPYSVLWATPGADPDIVRAYETPTLRFVTKPVDLRHAGTQADAAVLYGSHGTAAAMLLAGVPMTLCPNHVEQMLVARNVARLGACNVLRPDMSVNQAGRSIESIVEDAAYNARAGVFASRYAGFDAHDAASLVAARVHERCKGAYA
jgi:UDP:flavonoid glycosyltransferase YjiC (YdhE family)